MQKRKAFIKLRSKMLEEGVTQKDLAAAINISLPSLGNKLSERSSFTIAEAKAIMEQLSIDNPTEYFFG